MTCPLVVRNRKQNYNYKFDRVADETETTLQLRHSTLSKQWVTINTGPGPRTGDPGTRGPGTQGPEDRGPKDQGPNDLALLHLAFMTEMQLVSMF